MKVFLCGLAVMWVTVAQAQVGGFASVGYGYHSDPMYNFATIPDQVRQGYLELQYMHDAGTGTLMAGYTGGLMIFNEFTDRNYLEHALRLAYRDVFGTVRPGGVQPAIPQPPDEDTGDNDGEESGGPADPDSGRTYLDLHLRGSARHDKQAFREFDNTGIALTAIVRLPLGGWYVRLANDIGLRSYTNLVELSNLTEHLTLQLGTVMKSGVNAGVALAGGMKYYTNDLYDTTLYQSSGNSSSKGNGKGKAVGAKKVLTNATTTTAWQFAGGAYAGISWTQGMASFTGWYRYNPGKGTRYLAQYANTSMLDEDIYNDFFSYEGPEGRIVVRQELPAGLYATLSCGGARRQFQASALDLDQTDTGKKRRDIAMDAEFSLSRLFPLNEHFGLDLALTTACLRNQSNDAYNDYGLWQVGMSVGVGF